MQFAGLLSFATFLVALVAVSSDAAAQSCTPTGAAMSSLDQWRSACQRCGGRVVGSGASMKCEFSPASSSTSAPTGGFTGSLPQLGWQMGYAIGTRLRQQAEEAERAERERAMQAERERQQQAFEEQARRLQHEENLRQISMQRNEAQRREEERAQQAEARRREEVYQRVTAGLIGTPAAEGGNTLGLIGLGSDRPGEDSTPAKEIDSLYR